MHIVLTALSDAEGLQTELAKHGITATVTYGGSANPAALPAADSLPVPTGNPTASQTPTSSAGLSGTDSSTGASTPDNAAEECGTSNVTAPRLQIGADKAVIDIPAGSIPTGEHLSISTAGSDTTFASITATWTGTHGICGTGTAIAHNPPNSTTPQSPGGRSLQAVGPPLPPQVSLRDRCATASGRL